MTDSSATEEKTARYTLRYKSCEQCKQSKRLSTFGHGGDICIQCLRYLNDPHRHFPDLNRQLLDQNLPSILEGLQKSAEAAQISHQEIYQHLNQLTIRVSNLESRDPEPQVTEPDMESKDSEIQQIRKLMADTEAEAQIWKSRSTSLEAQLSSTHQKIKILEQHAVAQQQILDQKALELEKITRESNQVVIERDNLREKWEKQEVEIQSQRAQSVTEIQRLKEELKEQEHKYLTEIREPQARMTPSTSGSSQSEKFSPRPNRYIMSPSQGYGPLVAERRLVYEPQTPSSPIQALAAWVPAVVSSNTGAPGAGESRTTPRKPPSIKFPSPRPKKS